MTHEEKEELLNAVELDGFHVDHGDQIDGPWIPDGTVRIYDPSTLNIYGYGRTVEEALDDFSDGFEEYL